MNTETDFNRFGQCEDGSTSDTCGSKEHKGGNKKEDPVKTQSQINKYVTSLITTAVGPHFKVSEMDLGNQMQVFVAASLGIRDKQIVSAADLAFKTIRDKLDATIKTHLNHVEASYTNKHCYYKDTENKCLGDLKFENPTIFLKSLDPSHADVGRMITPTDRLLAYKFFMFRETIKEFARKLEPDWVVTFSEDKSTIYTRHDVLNSFLYIDNEKTKFKGHTGNKVNIKAWKILSSEIKEVENIIKSVFEEYSSDCNQLKTTTDMGHQITVCQNLNEVTDPDYFLNLLTCLETFNLATTAGFCKDTEYEDFDWE
jgi:hypothetical protein